MSTVLDLARMAATTRTSDATMFSPQAHALVVVGMRSLLNHLIAEHDLIPGYGAYVCVTDLYRLIDELDEK